MTKTSQNKKNNIKSLIGKLHLWLGLTVGVLVFIISITGAIYAFQVEITDYLRKNVIYHGEENSSQKRILPIKELEKKVNDYTQEKYPLHWVNVPIDKKMCYVFYYYEHTEYGWNYFNEYIIYKSVYVNPYSGKILAVYDEKNNFFTIIKFLHYSFLLKTNWGPYVTGIPTLIFLVMLITGIVLWWPRNKAARKQRFWFNWKNIKNWKRKNYDLHNILGFYASFVALIIAISGLFYSFFFIQALIYFVFSGGSTVYPDFSHIKTKAPIEMRNEQTLDKIGKQVEALYPNAYMYSLDFGYPHIDHHEHPNYAVFVKQLSYSYHINHSLVFDENSGELLHIHDHKEKNMGEKAIAANYDIHVGSILGLSGKLLAFIVSLICASLPVTGFMVWLGRKRENTK